MTGDKDKLPVETSAAELRKSLVNRLGMAGVLVAVLLGMLALFDHLASTPEEPDLPVFNKPVPVAPRKEVSQPVTQAANLPEPPDPQPQTAPVVEPPPPPVVEAPKPVVADRPKAASSENRPNVASTAASKPPAGNAPVVVSRAPPRAAPEATAAPDVPLAAPASERASAPPASARVVETRPTPAIAPPAAPRLFSGFLLQAGVFSSAQRAEELHAKLTLSGVPSTIETRVQVGPFRTRQEAEAAQHKLKSLGIESVLVPPKGSKP